MSFARSISLSDVIGPQPRRSLPAKRMPCPMNGRALAAIIAELKRDAEVLLAQQSHDFLQFVLGRRGDAQLVALNGGLHLFQLRVLEELDDVFGLFGRDALL